jgi:hypothetical protein
MRWPFAEWGAEVIFAGHDHTYERLDVGGTPYFVNGAGGQSLYNFSNLGALPTGVTSTVRYNDGFGAMLVTATETGLTSQFFNTAGILIDEYTLSRRCLIESAITPLPTPALTATPQPASSPALTLTISPAPTPTPMASTDLYLPGISAGGNTEAAPAEATPQTAAGDVPAGLIDRVASWLSGVWNSITRFWK